MLQFASSDSSAQSVITKAESMSRKNHFHDEMRWRAVGMLQAGARQSAVARELKCIVVSAIGCGTITKGIKTPVEDVRLDAGESPQRHMIATCCTNSATAGVAALCCCRKAHIPPNCVAQIA
ncbi:hypothetical protein AVEN_178668-1 [Araneus ventricosus]|uniref:Uncharacterized protein n=1 Tax=Araneus ventricosus TaxID=182803 RepID=A0A4Y2I8Y4_ARAVE|nr:hypothetical protein AVEN_178668-1 [Araneus ventricosus]